MFDAKYNSLFDNACFRIAVNCALFVVWVGAAYGSLAVPLAAGLALTCMVAALGHISGAHFNPAVTLGLAVTGRFRWRHVPVYLVAQLLGVTWTDETAAALRHVARNPRTLLATALAAPEYAVD